MAVAKKPRGHSYERPTPSLSERVQQLVEHFFAGSVNAAANAWGIPQPTLHRIVDGATKSPRAELLAKIAAAHSTTIEWLLSGTGEGPQLTRQTMGLTAPITRHVLAWTELLDALDLPPQMKHAMTEAVFAPWWMFSTLKRREAPEHPDSADRVREAVESSAVAHITALRALLESYGTDAIRGALLREADRGKLWFNPFGSWLTSASVLPQDLTELYGSYLEYDKGCSQPNAREQQPAEQQRRVPTRMPRNKARVTTPEDHRMATHRTAKRTA